MTTTAVHLRVGRASPARVLDSVSGGRDHVTMTVRTIKVTREDVARARRASLERAGVTVSVSPSLLARARTQGDKLRSRKRDAA